MMEFMQRWPYSPYSTTFIFSLIFILPAFIFLFPNYLRKIIPSITRDRSILIAALLLVNYMIICVLADVFVVDKLKFAAEPILNLSINLVYFIVFVCITTLQFHIAFSLSHNASLQIATRAFLIFSGLQLLVIFLLPFFVTHVRAIYFFW